MYVSLMSDVYLWLLPMYVYGHFVNTETEGCSCGQVDIWEVSHWRLLHRSTRKYMDDVPHHLSTTHCNSYMTL